MFKQRKYHTRVAVSIEETGVRYSLRNNRLEKTELIPFENIGNGQYTLFENEKQYLHHAVFTATLGLVLMLASFFYQMPHWGWLLLVAAAAFYGFYRFSTVKLRAVSTEGRHDMLLIDNKNAENFLGEMFASRNKYLRREYGRIDYEADPTEEIEKFRWLMDLGVISSREFEVISEEIENGY